MAAFVSQNIMEPVTRCPVCGGGQFIQRPVLWPELVAEWQLSEGEARYIDRQQGYCCESCGANLRSMALAEAIVKSYGYAGTLEDFCRAPENADLKVLEINPAGTLTPYLSALPNHRLVNYPEYDMTKLDVSTGSVDLVVHSDTLEHVDFPDTGLGECRRILRGGGRCIFTIPIVVGRLSRSRSGLSGSYHGCARDVASDLLVQTEFGADFWTTVLSAGFRSCTIYSLEYPAGLAIGASC